MRCLAVRGLERGFEAASTASTAPAAAVGGGEGGRGGTTFKIWSTDEHNHMCH